MEEKYPELKNLMPRDVVSREMYFVLQNDSLGGQVYLDLRGLSHETWKKKLPDLRQEIMDYLTIDPAKEPVPVEPGIHYFMGGIDVDAGHHTNIAGLYAAGECCSLYHGANRLGGNSLLGAIYGGSVAAESVYRDYVENRADSGDEEEIRKVEENEIPRVLPELIQELSDILYGALGIVRNETEMQNARKEVEKLEEENRGNEAAIRRLKLAEMMLFSAIYRKESRGAHYRSDYPDRDEKFQGYIKCDYSGVIDELSIKN
jgi:succinate dehydrogenase / fumarate reductase flavoprotein subunit